jgi:hypothetical protein
MIKKLKLTETLILDGHVLPVGSYVDGIKVNKNTFKIFHHTGWWKINKKQASSVRG